MSTMDPGKYREYVEKLQQEEQRLVALNDIKNLLIYLPAGDAASLLNNHSMAPIFNCLLAIDKAQFDLTCELLKICFEKFNPGEVIKKYTGNIMFLLRHDNSCLRKLAVEEIYRCILENPEFLPVPDYIDVFVAVSQLVADSDVGIANKAILVTSHLPKEAYVKVLEEMKFALQMNSSSKCNALEAVINISTSSPELLELSAQHGYIKFLLMELNSKDVLYERNILELLSRLAVTPHGINYLVRHGALTRISNCIVLSKRHPSGSLLMPGYIRFLGSIGHLYPREILEDYPVFIRCLFNVFETRDQTVMPVALDTIGYIASSIEGKLSLVALGSTFTFVLENICELIRSGRPEMKMNAVVCFANLIAVEKDLQFRHPVGPRVSLMTREWFRGLNRNPPSPTYLMNMCKNPYVDIRLAAFQLLDAVCQHRWGEEMVFETAGFVEYLLDRKVDHTKESKERKFEIIKRLSSSTVFDAMTSLAFKKFVADGPFKKELAVQVAMQDGN